MGTSTENPGTARKIDPVDTVCVLILLIFPLVKCTLGVDIGDTGYNLGNFMYPDRVDGMWYMSTYLSGQLGHFFVMLPFGDTLAGIRFYTGLVPSATALISYRFFRVKLGAKPIPTVCGLLAAEGLCWCPTTLLYNYLTYLLVTVMMILLYLGVTEKTRQSRYFFYAGVTFGSSIWVRFPNVFEVFFILVIFLYPIFCSQGKSLKITQVSPESGAKGEGSALSPPLQLLWSIAGAVSGYLFWLLTVVISGRFEDYLGMFDSLLRVSDEAPGYSFTDMARSAIDAFLVRGYYIRWLLIALAFGCCLFFVYNRFTDGKAAHALWSIALPPVYIAVITAIIIRLIRGNFVNTNYRATSSFMSIAAVWLFFMVLWLLYSMVGGSLIPSAREANRNTCITATHANSSGSSGLPHRSFAAFSLLLLLQLLILPFGSNNNIYPVVNCLFLMAPFIFLKIRDCLRAKEQLPMAVLMAILSLLLLSQGIGSGLCYVFGENDGDMDSVITEVPCLKGMRTTIQRCDELQGTYAFLKDQGLLDAELLTYGDVPALSPYMGMRPAISSMWPDLESFSSEKFIRELSSLSTKPVIIMGNDIYYRNEKKEAALLDFMEKNSYVKSAEYDEFTVWTVR